MGKVYGLVIVLLCMLVTQFSFHFVLCSSQRQPHRYMERIEEYLHRALDIAETSPAARRPPIGIATFPIDFAILCSNSPACFVPVSSATHCYLKN